MLLLALLLALALTTASPLNLASNLTANLRCTTPESYQKWTSDYFLIEDCFAAVHQVYIDYVIRGPDVPYEFHALGRTPKTKNPWIRTPTKWTVNSCTLAIVTLDRVVQGELPGNIYKPYAQHDTTTFTSICKAGRIVENNCLVPLKLAGWEPTGSSSNIGVFLWPTDSDINYQITDGSQGSTVLPALLNAPSVSDLDVNTS